MKKLKIFLPILLISLFFIPKVSASTLLEGKLRLRYNDTTLGYLTEYETKLNNLRDYLQSVNEFTSGWTFRLDSGNYIVRVQNINTDTLKVWLLDGANTSNYFKSEYTEYNKRIQYYIASYISFNVNFNGNNVVSHDTYTVGNTFFNWSNSYPSECNLYDEICIANTASYMDTYFYTNTSTVPFNHCTGTNCSEFGFKVNDYTYNPGDNIDIKILFDNLIPYSNPFACNIDIDSLSGFRDGVVSNIDEFSIHIKGTIPDDSDSFDGSFALKSNSNRLVNDPNIVFDLDITDLSDNNIGGAAAYDWYNDENILVVTYSLGNSPGEDIDMIISVKPDSSSTTAISFFSKSLSIFYCNPLNFNGDITYGYIDSDTDISYSSDTSLMNYLNDSNGPDLSFFTNFRTLLPSGPIDSFLSIPLKVLNELNNSLNGQCSPKVINLPYVNGNITLPCISSFYTNIGASNFVNYVGVIGSTFMLIQYFTFLYNWLEDVFLFSHKKLKTWGTGGVD